MSNNNENNSKNKHFEFGEKRFSSNSWKKFENEQTKQLFKNYLNINDFIDIEKDQIQNITDKQETNSKINNLFSKSFVDLKQGSTINGWNYRRNKNIEDRKNNLAFLYVVNYYFMFELKKKNLIGLGY